MKTRNEYLKILFSNSIADKKYLDVITERLIEKAIIIYQKRKEYIDLINLTLDDIVKLKNMINNTDKTLVMVSCCACNKNLFNENYYKLKEISDLMILTDE